MGSNRLADMASICVLLTLLVFDVTVSNGAEDTVNIAAILDVNTPAGRTANMSLHFALQDINDEAASGTRLNLTIQESRGIVENILQVFRSEFAAILLQDHKISKLLAPVAEDVHVPILSFSGANGFGTLSGSKYLLPTIQSRYDDMKAIAAITAYFQWKSVAVVYEDDELWLSGVYALTEALQEFQEKGEDTRTTISRTAALSSRSRLDQRNQIKETLLDLNESCVRAFIVHTSVDVALNMFSMAQELGMMNESYVWVVTDSVASSFDSLSFSTIQTLQGIVGVKSVPTSQFTELQQRLRLISADDGVNRIGIQAYSSLRLIASAVAALRSHDIKIGYDGQIPKNDTDLPYSMTVLTGGDFLRREIERSMSGAFRDGLDISEYEIVNVVGRSYRTVGFWRKDTGRLQSARKEENKVGGIIWPGDTTQVPNGFRKLVVGNVKGIMDEISGYTNDIFEAAVGTLPYNLPFVYVDFDKGNSTIPNYDAFITDFINGNRYDMVVGPATILWNRSLYVGFSQPFSQMGLVMMVPKKKVRGLVWSFLYPFTAALWAIIGAFFVVAAFFVWLVEHDKNNEFQGGVTQQVVTSLTLSFSAFLFFQRDEVKSSLGKGIIATCLIISLILNNSYTAHLTSILTVERLAPTITNIKSLSTSNVKVGYRKTSFIRYYLTDTLKIPHDRLIPLGSSHDYVLKLLNNEVDAIVDESQYIEIVKSLYPSDKFTVVDQGYFDTGGLGFFFRKGSPFLADISEAVLNISEQHYAVDSIRSKWFGERVSRLDLETRLDSNSSPITPSNLWILFVLTASIYAIAVFIHIARKLRQMDQDWRASQTHEFSTHVLAMIKSSQSMRACVP